MLQSPLLLSQEWFRLYPNQNDTTSVTVETLPYLTQRTLNCKLRWRGKTIYEIFRIEFALDSSYVDSACSKSKILLNDLPCVGSQIVLNGDTIIHSWIAVEPSISFPAESLPRILEVDPLRKVIAVFKPHSLATVPQGKFFRLNLTSLVKNHQHISNMHPINRLDRAVSGLVLFSTETTSEICAVNKRYFAEVAAPFPQDVLESTAKLRVEKHASDQVLRTVIDEINGNESRTVFVKLSKNFVECRPITGRTHQIRAHLAGLGCPIVGDSSYSDDFSIEQMSQPEKIHLFCFEYEIKKGSENHVFSCPKDLIPSWLPIELVLGT